MVLFFTKFVTPYSKFSYNFQGKVMFAHTITSVRICKPDIGNNEQIYTNLFSYYSFYMCLFNCQFNNNIK